MLFPTWRRVTSWAMLLQFCILSFAQAEFLQIIPADEIPKVGFPPDTLVWTYDRAGQAKLSPIKDCEQGQEVASVNIETGKLEPATIDGALVRTSSLIEIDLEQNCDGATQSYTMCLCAEHKILSPTLEKLKIIHAWREAQDLQPDHLVWTYNPTTQSRLRLARVVAVRKPEQCNINSPVVCLSLDKNHNFLVGHSGLIAHNAAPLVAVGISLAFEGFFTNVTVTAYMTWLPLLAYAVTALQDYYNKPAPTVKREEVAQPDAHDKQFSLMSAEQPLYEETPLAQTSCEATAPPPATVACDPQGLALSLTGSKTAWGIGALLSLATALWYYYRPPAEKPVIENHATSPQPALHATSGNPEPHNYNNPEHASVAAATPGGSGEEPDNGVNMCTMEQPRQLLTCGSPNRPEAEPLTCRLPPFEPQPEIPSCVNSMPEREPFTCGTRPFEIPPEALRCPYSSMPALEPLESSESVIKALPDIGSMAKTKDKDKSKTRPSTSNSLANHGKTGIKITITPEFGPEVERDVCNTIEDGINAVFQPSKKHPAEIPGKIYPDWISPGPRDQETAERMLINSYQAGKNTRIGFDPESGQICVFHKTKTNPHKTSSGVDVYEFHGNLQKWGALKGNLKPTLIKTGHFNEHGKFNK